MSYAVVHPEGAKKPVCVKILKQNGNLFVGVRPDHTMYGDGARVEYRGRDVVVLLGDEPPVGSVYGAWVEPVVKRRIAKGWGDVFWYVKADDVVVERVHKGLRVARKKLAAMGIDGWLTSDFVTEVRNVKGRINATYHYKPKAADKIIYRNVPGQGLREIVKVLAHEGGHGVWNRIMSPEERSVWIELYEQYVSVKTVTTGDVKHMVKQMRQLEGVRPFLKDAEPEEQAAANIYLGWLRKVHRLSPREVQDLLAAGRKLPQPDTHLHRSETSTPITLYSKTAPDELFYEALSSYVIGDLADKRIRRLVKEVAR